MNKAKVKEIIVEEANDMARTVSVYKVKSNDNEFWNKFEGLLLYGFKSGWSVSVVILAVQEERELEFFTEIHKELRTYGTVEEYTQRFYSEESDGLSVDFELVEMQLEQFEYFNWNKERLNDYGIKKLEEYNGPKYTKEDDIVCGECRNIG